MHAIFFFLQVGNLPEFYVANEFPKTTVIKNAAGEVLDDDAIEAAIDKAIVEHDMNKLVDYVLEGGTDRLRDKVLYLPPCFESYFQVVFL